MMTLCVRGGSLAALAAALALSLPAVPAAAQDMPSLVSDAPEAAAPPRMPRVESSGGPAYVRITQPERPDRARFEPVAAPAPRAYAPPSAPAYAPPVRIDPDIAAGPALAQRERAERRGRPGGSGGGFGGGFGTGAQPDRPRGPRAEGVWGSQRGGEQRARQIDRRSEQRARQIDRQSEERARQIDRRSEWRARDIEQRGDARARQFDLQGRERAAREIDRRTDAAARRIENRGDLRARQVENRGDWRADRVENRGDRRALRAEGWQGGLRAGGRNDGWRDDWRRDDWRRDGWRRGDNRNWRRDDWRWGWNGRPGWDNRNFRRWDNRWRNDRRFDWFDFRRGNRFLFSPGPYFAPFRNHRYIRLSQGFFLDSLFFQPRFFINDPWTYRLPPVYGPYQWVRYYDDVVLVDIYTGEVIDVIHNFFW